MNVVFANDLQLMSQQARFEAVKRNTPGAIIWNATEKRFELKHTPGCLTGTSVCTSGQTVKTKSLTIKT